MIRVTKPTQAPRILRERGKATTEANCSAFDSAPVDYSNGIRTFEFDSGLYGAKSVKNSLIKAQHRKCCFCESKVTDVAYGDVEHFRPKGGFRQIESDPLGRPGYYWLAYAWENLFFSCQLCNQRFKRTLFPLEDPNQRALSHNDDLSLEKPLFVDPSQSDPEEYIAFREEYPYAVDSNAIGRATIEGLGLAREELNESRRDLLEKLKIIKILADMPVPESTEAQALLVRAVREDSEYSSMARAAIA